MITMSETTFEKQVLNKLASVEKKVMYIVDYIEDTKLSEDDKKALKAALNEEKAGKLLSKKQVFGCAPLALIFSFPFQSPERFLISVFNF